MSPNSNSGISTSPNEDLVIPKWVNEEYFQEILEKDVPNYAHIVDFKTVAATAPGENYTSIMVRVEIEIELKDKTRQSISYILKTCFESGEGAALVKSMNLFPREKQMYQDHLQQFEKLYKETGLDVKLSPKCLHIEETPERITLVMEDLKRQNFRNIDRLEGMDLEHCSRVLKKLAELHAASAMYYELNGAFDQMYMTSFFNEANRPIFEALAVVRQKAFFAAMREWGLENAEWYIENSPPPATIFEEGLRINKIDPNEFNVLNHGDSWVNNIMFKHNDKGDIDDMVFVDYQVCKWGTPAQDLWYFITTSPSLDIKVKEFDHFIYIYHKRLEECLKMLKYPKHIPTLKEIHIMLLKYGYWGIFTANGTLSVVLYPSDKDANMDNMLKNGPEAEEFRYKIFSNPAYGRACCQLYPFFNNKGLWEIESRKQDSQQLEVKPEL